MFMFLLTASLPILIIPPEELICNAPTASIFIALPLRDVVALSAEPKVKSPVPLGSIEISPPPPVVIVIPPDPLVTLTTAAPVALPIEIVWSPLPVATLTT